MKKTIELEMFEALTADNYENTGQVSVVFLDRKLLRMADDFKKKNLINSSSRPKKTPLR